MEPQIDYEKLAQTMMANMQKAQESAEKEQSWKSRLTHGKDGLVKNSIDNYILFLTEDPRYKGLLKYNEFLVQREYKGKEFTDFDLNIIYNNCEREIGLSAHQKIDSALWEVFDKNRYNPVYDYVTNLTWDGKERISRLFIDLLEADDTRLNMEMTKKWFIAAIKRVIEPGCKFDNIIVLQGGQGIGKSSICELISKSFFNTVSLAEIGNKDLVDKLNKTWIAIIDELDTFNKKEMSTIKTFLSLTNDSTRLAYAKNTNTYQRHCVFIGSTNDDTFLRDSTSSVERRFWVIKCNKTERDNKIRTVLTDEYINQLWAEAYHYYKEDPNQYLDISAEMTKDFEETQRDFKTYTDDTCIDNVRDILDRAYCTKNGEFNSPQTFLNQYNGSFVPEGETEKLYKVPMNYLTYVLKSFFKEERSAKYIALALSNEWEYKTIKYNGKACKGLYRKDYKVTKTLDESFEAIKLFN